MGCNHYDKQKMLNYYLISALLFLSGIWKVFIIKTQGAPLEAAGGKGEDVIISIVAFLLFGAIFLIMGLRHTCGILKEKYHKPVDH